MSKVKNLTLLSQKMKKGGNFDTGCQNQLSRADLFCNVVSRLGLIVTNMSLFIEWK